MDMDNDYTQADGLIPRSIQEILALTFRIYSENVVAFLTASAIVIIPLAVVTFALSEILIDETVENTINASIDEDTGEITDLEFNADVFGSVFGAAFIMSIATLLIQQVFLNGVFTYLTSESLLGRQITPTEAFQAITPRFATLGIGLLMVYGILVAVSFGLAFTFFLCGLGIGLIVYLGVNLFSFLVPTIILENVSAGRGLRRSFALAKARFWPVLWLTVAVTIITALVQLLFSIVPNLGDSALMQTIISSGYTVVVAPIMPIALTLMYYDTRIRLEGLDMGMAAVESDTPRPADVPSSELNIQFARDDFTTVLTLSIGLIVFVVLLSLLFGGFTTAVVSTP